MPTPKRCPKSTQSRKPRRSVLRFTPTAWSKLLFLRDRGETEIGGFGISAAEELLRIEDVVLVPQQASLASVAFDDAAVADFFDGQIDQSRRPEQFARIWIHTHPGHDPSPSPLDEATFARVFGRCDWALMVIVARGGAAYVRLQWHVGPRGRQPRPVEVDLRHSFAGSDQFAWGGRVRPLRRSGPAVRRTLAGRPAGRR